MGIRCACGALSSSKYKRFGLLYLSEIITRKCKLNRLACRAFFGSILSMLFGASGSQAAEYSAKGLVELVRMHDAEIIPDWQPPKFWFALKGVTGVQNCSKFSNGSVLFLARDVQMLALIMTALRQNLEVRVDVDPQYPVNGYCAAKQVTIGASVPL
jgi:hypothetical protein